MDTMENSKKDRFDGTLNDALLILEETKSKKDSAKTEEPLFIQEKQKKSVNDEDEEGWDEEENWEEDEDEEDQEQEKPMEKKEREKENVGSDNIDDEDLAALRKQKKKKDLQTLAVLFFLAVVMLIGAYFMFFASPTNTENQEEPYINTVAEPLPVAAVEPVVTQRIKTEYASEENSTTNNGQQQERISEEYATQTASLPEAIPVSETVPEVGLVCTAFNADVAVNIFAVVNGVAYISTDIFTLQTFKTLPKEEVAASFNGVESVFTNTGGFYLLKSHVEKFYKCE